MVPCSSRSDDIIAANEAHNRIGQAHRPRGGRAADRHGGRRRRNMGRRPLPDIVHFTEAGNERVANLMFRALLPILAERHGVKMRGALIESSVPLDGIEVGRAVIPAQAGIQRLGDKVLDARVAGMTNESALSNRTYAGVDCAGASRGLSVAQREIDAFALS